jgi:DNA polymerase III epsilon subunit-like protein
MSGTIELDLDGGMSGMGAVCAVPGCCGRGLFSVPVYGLIHPETRRVCADHQNVHLQISPPSEEPMTDQDLDRVYTALAQHSEGRSGGCLARDLLMPQTTVSRHLRELEQRGRVTRVGSSSTLRWFSVSPGSKTAPRPAPVPAPVAPPPPPARVVAPARPAPNGQPVASGPEPRTGTALRKVLDHVRAHPGQTGAQIVAGTRERDAHGLLANLRRRGLVHSQGEVTHDRTAPITWHPGAAASEPVTPPELVPEIVVPSLAAPPPVEPASSGEDLPAAGEVSLPPAAAYPCDTCAHGVAADCHDAHAPALGDQVLAWLADEDDETSPCPGWAEAPRRPLQGVPLAVLDVETTGLDSLADRVIEIAVVHVTPGEEAPRLAWSSLVRAPLASIPEAQGVHGIPAAELAAAPEFGAVVQELLAALAGRTVVAWHAPFDFAFLAAETGRVGAQIPPAWSWLDPLAWEVHLHPSGDHHLAACCTRRDVEHNHAHRAAGDALATTHLLIKILRDLAGRAPAELDAFLAWQGEVIAHQEMARSVRHGARVRELEGEQRQLATVAAVEHATAVGNEAAVRRLEQRITELEAEAAAAHAEVTRARKSEVEAAQDSCRWERERDEAKGLLEETEARLSAVGKGLELDLWQGSPEDMRRVAAQAFVDAMAWRKAEGARSQADVDALTRIAVAVELVPGNSADLAAAVERWAWDRTYLDLALDVAGAPEERDGIAVPPWVRVGMLTETDLEPVVARCHRLLDVAGVDDADELDQRLALHLARLVRVGMEASRAA